MDNVLSRVKHIPLISYEEGVSLQHLADDAFVEYEKNLLYKQAGAKYRDVLRYKPYAADACYNWAKCTKSRALLRYGITNEF
jgi:hypothetical protein